MDKEDVWLVVIVFSVVWAGVAVLALSLMGCASPETPEQNTPATHEHTPQPKQDFDAGVQNTPSCPAPVPVTFADVVPDTYHLVDTCADAVQDLGLAPLGAIPTYAWSPEKGQLYLVVGRYEGGLWVQVGDKCLPGGPYEGYDLFTLEPLP